MIITLKDGSKREVKEGISVIDLAKEISEGLARVATAGRVDGKVVDLRYNLNKDCNVEILTFDDEDGKKAYWHTTSHIMAQAIKRLYKDVKLAIGPAIDGGFYYDFDTEYRFSEADFEKIEAEMKKIIKEDLPTLDLPTKTTSGNPLDGYCFGLTAEISNLGFQGRTNRRLTRRRSFIILQAR